MKKILFREKKYAEGGDISLDMCYANYNGYKIQSTRCNEEGVDFIMVGEYRDVARDLKKDFAKEWLYYNRMARIYIDVPSALKFVKEANKHFKPSVEIYPFFYDIDRSFATYRVNSSRPTQDIPIDVGALVRTDNKPKDKRTKEEESRKVERQLKKRESQEPPIIEPSQWKEVDGEYWWIGMVVNQGNDEMWGKEWKNNITNKHLPEDDGISLFTLIHEYAHCLDYNNSIKRKKYYEVPAYEMELATGEDFTGNKYSKAELKEFRKRNEAGQKQFTLLSTHSEYFVDALADILRAGDKGEIPILNKLDKEVIGMELNTSSNYFTETKRQQEREDYLERNRKKIELANTPYLRFALPEQFKAYIEPSDIGYIAELPKNEINLDLGLDLMPFIADFESYLQELMYVNPTRNSKSLEDIKRVKVDILRMIKRLGGD